ncbi:hypothetical protein EDD16DRAFT_637098 [Pisolithus croceorrhizus]|nr:hypothetical protein EDD16DRAFT_637098 [Pisolithus croceorrhizus]
MQFRAESLATCRRASPRRHLPDDIRDITHAFVVAELFGFLCLSRVMRSGSCVSLTFASCLSLLAWWYYLLMATWRYPFCSYALDSCGDMRVLCIEGVRGDLADISGLGRSIGLVPFSPSLPRCPLPLSAVSYRLPQWSLLGSLLFSLLLLPYTLFALHLPQFFALPFAFLGLDTTRPELSNGIPRVVIRAALVEKSGFSCGEVSLASFADILGWGARIHLISFPMSSL